MKKTLYSSVITLLISTAAIAQDPIRQNWCGSIEAMEANFKNHPELRQQFEIYQAQANQQQQQQLSQHKTAAATYTIPVVFHILHQYGAENITDAQINDQMAIFNRDYNLQNADTNVVIPPFKNLIGDIHFDFVLAKKDPSGNCTSGINRYYDANTASWAGNFNNYIYTWNPTRYLNIYVVKTIASGAAGYAYYPGSLGTGSNMDAIVILSNYVGSIGTSSALHSRALTHEAGHWLNLQHTWGNTNDPGVACGDDQVGDTPQTMGFTSCSTEAGSKICNPAIAENYQNYMDYSYCSVMFTPGQGTRMTNAINSSAGGRNNLSSASNLNVTGITPAASCSPSTDFTANKLVICAGQSVNFSDLTNVGTPTSWNWDFQGGTPAIASVQNPTVTYSTPGTYSVALTTSNGSGTSVESKINYITVTAPPTTSSLIEGFEGSAIPNATWAVRNLSMLSTNWEQTSATSASGSKSIKIDESIEPGSTVELYSPSYNFSGMPNVALTIKWAGSERNATSTSFDVFSIQVSTNCGVSWAPRLTRNIRTGSPGVSTSVAGNFVPTPSQFVQETVTMAGLTAFSNVMFKLRFVAETGSSNNFYVDDINLTSATGIEEQLIASNIQLYPNPATDQVTVEFDLLEDRTIDIEVKDVLGRSVITPVKRNLQSGHHESIISLNHLSRGIYFVSVNSSAGTVTKKVIVE